MWWLSSCGASLEHVGSSWLIGGREKDRRQEEEWRGDIYQSQIGWARFVCVHGFQSNFTCSMKSYFNSFVVGVTICVQVCWWEGHLMYLSDYYMWFMAPAIFQRWKSTECRSKVGQLDIYRWELIPTMYLNCRTQPNVIIKLISLMKQKNPPNQAIHGFFTTVYFPWKNVDRFTM